MDAKTELVATLIRILSRKTNLVPKPDAMSELISTIFGGETYDVRYAKAAVRAAEQAAVAAKRANTTRKFNKIIKTAL